MTPPSSRRPASFGAFCIASLMLSVSYGSTFLLTLLITSFGGDERDAGQVISVAMISTIAAVVGSGHLADKWGPARCIAMGAGFLAAASSGFAIADSLGPWLMVCALMLGLGWGVFYTLGPIMVAGMVEPNRRSHSFALLSGSMLTGIGTGPLAGKLASYFDLPIQTAFFCAAIMAVAGGVYFWRTGQHFHTNASSNDRAQIGLDSAIKVLTSKAAFSILMVGLGGAIFGGLGSFQTSYASSLGLDYSVFFICFMGAAICCRLLIASWVVKRNPFAASCVLSAIMLVAVLSFGQWVHDIFSYGLAAALLGIGYGLNYSVINGLAANEAPCGLTAQSLLLFSLAYFLGVFGFPFIAGKLIVHGGVNGMLFSTGLVALLVWVISLGRWLNDALLANARRA